MEHFDLRLPAGEWHWVYQYGDGSWGATNNPTSPTQIYESHWLIYGPYEHRAIGRTPLLPEDQRLIHLDALLNEVNETTPTGEIE